MNEYMIEEAETELKECKRLRPGSPEPLAGLAACAAERGDWDQAQAFATEALALDPKSPIALHAQGGLYLSTRKLDSAIAVYEKLVRLYPRDKRAHLNLARAYSQKGNQELAKKHEDRFQELDRSPTIP